MNEQQENKLKSLVRNIPDFPAKGILFRDLTTVFKNPEGLAIISDEMAANYKDKGVTKVVGIEARGFIGGSILAREVGAGFVPLRKPGKLPADTISRSYKKEYGVDTIEIHRDSITPDDIVVIHDDLLATGGTMLAAYELVKSMCPKKIYIDFIVELKDLDGRALFPADVPVTTMLVF